jgi:hypothetical protein
MMQAVTNQVTHDSQRAIVQELDFLIQRTGQDELTLLSQAMRLGLGLLYRQTAEQAFIDDLLTRSEAVAALGAERVSEIEYAKQALAQDVRRGLDL